MNKKFPVNMCPNTNAWCNRGDICVISTRDTLSGSHAYQHSFQHLLSYKLPTCSKHSWFYSNLPTGILYSQLNTSVSLPDSEYTKVFKCLHIVR